MKSNTDYKSLTNQVLGKAEVYRNLYVERRLLNTEPLAAWLRRANLRIDNDDPLHVTIAYSTDEVDWSRLTPLHNRLVVRGGTRTWAQYGKASVLTFTAPELQRRWKTFKEAGASWDFPSYNPHITVISGKETRDDLPPAFEDLPPFAGDLMFGPELFNEIKDS